MSKYDDMTPEEVKITPAQRKVIPNASGSTVPGMWDKIKSYLPDADTIEAATRGATQGATLGLGNKAQALIRAASPVQLDPNTGLAWNQDLGEYSKLRDEGAAQNAASAKAHPIAYAGGQIAGSLPGALVTGAGGVNAVKGIGTLGKTIAQTVPNVVARGAVGAAIPGAAIGAAQGAGAQDATPGSIMQSAGTNAAWSALGGGVAQKFAPVKAALVDPKVANSAIISAAEKDMSGLSAASKKLFASGQYDKIPKEEITEALSKFIKVFPDKASLAAHKASVGAAKEVAKTQAELNADAIAKKAASVAANVAPLGGGATGVLFPGVLPGTKKVESGGSVIDQAIGHGRNAAIGATQGYLVPKVPGMLERNAAPIGSTIANYLSGAMTPDTGTPTVESTPVEPIQSNEPYTPVDIDKYNDTTPVQDDKVKGQFGKLTDFLKQSSGTQNQSVQAVAAQAQQIADSGDPDAKRKAAMVLQGTPEGRAVGNSTSYINEQA